MRAREKNLRTAWLAPHIVDVGADAISVAEQFTRQQFVTSHDGLAATEIGHHVSIFHPFDDAVYDVANAVLEFLILAIALGFTDLLNDHLFGRLGRDTSIFERGQRLRNVIAHPG